MGKTADSWTVEGALSVTGAQTLTGATTCSSTLYANGPCTFPGSVLCGTQNSNYLANYAFFLVDSDGFKVSGMKWIDQNTGAYKTVYVHNGSVLTE